jgi:hypothetical protein
MIAKKLARSVLVFGTRTILSLTTSPKPQFKRVAIVIPLSNCDSFTDDENASIKQLQKYLGNYPIFYLVPKKSDLNISTFTRVVIPKCYFGSKHAHDALASSLYLFNRFANYEYIMIYHLDSLVFSNDLDYWCSKNLDYIGSPWIQCDVSPWVERERVGNGGFALIRVRSAINVLVERYKQNPVAFWLDCFQRKFKDDYKIKMSIRSRVLKFSKRAFAYGLRGKFIENVAMTEPNSDIFWSDIAIKYDSSFRVASFQQGVHWGFEVCPHTCMSFTAGKLPFGCHAWNRYNRNFWVEYLRLER